MKRKYYILLLLAICTLGNGCSRNFETATEENTREVVEFASLENNQEVAKSPSLEETTTENSAVNDMAEEPQMVRIENPSQDYYFADEKVAVSESAIELRQISSKANEIIDDEAWFEDNDLTLNTVIGTSGIMGELPDMIPTVFSYEGQNLSIVEAIQEDNFLYCIYGADYGEGYILQIYDQETQQLRYCMDFTDYRYANDYSPADELFVQQRIWWCSMVDDILYLSIGHNTYASSSPHTGYLVAIELSDQKVLWKSEPITCNSYNFTIIGDEIICGYGFTAEKDYLYQVDRLTGVRLEQIPIKSQANYIIQKDNLLYVRTYNTNYVFEMEQK